MEITKNEKKKNYSKGIALGVILLLALYFVLTRVTPFFTLTEESYSPYFWPRVNWVLPHVFCGMLALLIGPFQFSNSLRMKYVGIHRKSGYVYLAAVFIGSIAGGVLSLTSQVNLTYMVGLFSLAITWALTSGMALFFILKRKTSQHKEWMIRSYTITFGFVIFRIFDDILIHYQIGEQPDRLGLLSWACWVIPLMLIEPIIQYRRTFKRRKKSNS